MICFEILLPLNHIATVHISQLTAKTKTLKKFTYICEFKEILQTDICFIEHKKSNDCHVFSSIQN